MVKKLGFGLKNLVIKKSTRRLLFIGSLLFIDSGHGSEQLGKRLGSGTVSARTFRIAASRTVHRLRISSRIWLGNGSGVVAHGVYAGCRGTWSLVPRIAGYRRAAFRRAPGVHRRCWGKMDRDSSLSEECSMVADGVRGLLGQNGSRPSLARAWPRPSRWFPGIFGSRPGVARWCPAILGQAFRRAPCVLDSGYCSGYGSGLRGFPGLGS